jgi:hypothetical protein
MYSYIATGLITAAALAYSHYWTYERGVEHEKAQQSEVQELLRKVKEDAQQGAADAIGKIQLKQITIRQTLQKEILKEPVYINCKHTPDGLRAVNNALEGFRETGPDGTDKLPETAGTPVK